MSVVKIVSTLLALLVLPVTQGQSVIVHIPTSDAIDLARVIAKDEGYNVSDTKVFSFDLLMTKDGKPLLQGYTSIGFYINGDPRNTISFNNMTAQAVDMFSCEVFDYPELRSFQEDMIRLSKVKRKTAQELADDAGCSSPKVLTNPVAVQTSEGNAQTVLVPKGWTLADLGSGCAARLNGNEVDTMLSINDKDQVLLVAGRRDWSFSAGDVKLTLQFDSQPPRSFAAARWNNLALLVLVDDKDVVALRKASSIKWHLPDGDYSAKLHDAGSALDAASACTKEKRIGVSR